MFQGLSCRVTGETLYVFTNHGREVTNVVEGLVALLNQAVAVPFPVLEVPTEV